VLGSAEIIIVAKYAGRASIFIGFTPYHAHVVSRLIESCDEGKAYCYFSKLWPNSQRGYTRLGFSRRWMRGLDQVLSFFYFSFFIRVLAIRGYALDVYMPHPGNIFTNYLFFSSSHLKRTFIYEDGILNYYDAVQQNSFVGFWKRLLSVVAGMPYRFYKGHLAGYDVGCYDGAFLSMPELAVRREALGVVRVIPVCRKDLNVNNNVILFLDQSVEGILARGQRQACLNEMFRRYPVESYRYIYKPHHDYCSDISQSMLRLSSEEMGLPAELLIDILRPGHVISFFSSALVNVKNSFPAISCVSLASAMVKISRNGHQEPLSDLFSQVGVECLNVRDM
jgi:hypothetical protein